MNIDISQNKLSEHEFERIQSLYLKAKAKQCKVLGIFKYGDSKGVSVTGLKVLPLGGIDSSAIFIMRDTDED